jgi:maltose O-acetyltransferase
MKTPFNSLTTELITQRKSVHELCRQFSRSPSKGNLKRVKTLFDVCGEDVFIESGLHLDYGDNVSLGNRVYINVNCTILDSPQSAGAAIIIGDDCLIGPNVQLLSVSHDVKPSWRLAKKHNYASSITMGKNVWVGGGVIILAGVTIGDDSVIGAGSVVTKDVDAHSFYAGNPAKKVRAL